jgi:hypothetical protein
VLGSRVSTQKTRIAMAIVDPAPEHEIPVAMATFRYKSEFNE